MTDPKLTFDDIFEKLEGPAALGRAIGVTTEHAGSMRRRRSIPVSHWPSLIAALHLKGVAVVEADLVRIYKDEKESAAKTPEGAQP